MTGIDNQFKFISKIDRNDDIVYAAGFLKGDDAVLTICGDRTVRIWVKREGGHFWPTVCDYLADSVLCMELDANNRKLFVGLANGVIQEYFISEDLNRILHQRDYQGQIGRLRAVCSSFANEWLFSCASSNQLLQHCTQSGVQLSSSKLGAWGMSLQ